MMMVTLEEAVYRLERRGDDGFVTIAPM